MPKGLSSANKVAAKVLRMLFSFMLLLTAGQSDIKTLRQLTLFRCHCCRRALTLCLSDVSVNPCRLVKEPKGIVFHVGTVLPALVAVLCFFLVPNGYF